MKLNKAAFKDRVVYWLKRETGKDTFEAGSGIIYRAAARALMDEGIWDNRIETEAAVVEGKYKRACYLSAEFLMGRALGNNLINLEMEKDAGEALKELGLDLNSAEEAEPDAALGNGGLGRLAACFLDSLATLDYPARGYGIRYKYGMFRQEIKNSRQVEKPDDWDAENDPWSVRRENLAVTVRFGGNVAASPKKDGTFSFDVENTENIKAVPYDTPVTGWRTDTIVTLRLWEAEAENPFDFQQFNNMEYQRAVEKQTSAKNISMVLYPNDNAPPGKALRLRQQYFFASASMQDIIREFKKYNGTDFSELPDLYAVQLNDTHPVVAIPELMRILMDKENLEWENGWNITKKIFAYTNHTVLSEALEVWPIDLFRWQLPRIYQIIEEINRRYAGTGNRAVIADGFIHMARLAVLTVFSVNGVAALHTEILKNDVLKDWYALMPEKFNNKTNGVTQRRWLKKANPLLAGFLDKTIGDKWTKDLSVISDLKDFADDKAVLEELGKIKLENKVRLSGLIKDQTGISCDPESIFDVQVKRLHEYKRQLLNILSVIRDWQLLKDGNFKGKAVPRTVIFGAKAAPGYYMAKQIIYLINAVAETVNKDPETSDILKVVYIPDYKVSTAEIIFPGSDISQQISTAGKEASGTGNMKFMINGAVTLGTLDGANIEIAEKAGRKNIFIFGMNTEEVKILGNSGTYNPAEIVSGNPEMKRTMESLIDGTFSSDGSFTDIYTSLIYGINGSPADPYYVIEDFDSYIKIRRKVYESWINRESWNRKALYNIAGSGKFSSDRTIKQYAEEIWKIKPLKR